MNCLERCLQPPAATAVAEARLYSAGSDGATAGVVVGTAIGRPVVQQPAAPRSAVGGGQSSSAPVATSFLYTPSIAKAFSQFDTDGSGSIDLAELKRALAQLGLDGVDAAAALKGWDANGDGVIQLSEWEQGLSPAVRSKIESMLDSQQVAM